VRAAPPIALVAAALALPPASDSTGQTGAHRCLGEAATIVRGAGDNRIRGTSGNDVIVAGAGDDRIVALGFNDRVCAGPGGDRVVAGGGVDAVLGGAGRDRIAGGSGADRLRGGGRHDRIDGQRGTDRIRGNGGPDGISGGRGNDRIRGAAGSDQITGGLGDDVLLGGRGNADFLAGELGNDRLHGGAGTADIVRGDLGRDLMDGGAGPLDLASFTTTPNDAGVDVDLARGRAVGDGVDRLARVEDVAGSAFADRIRGDDGPNRADAGAGDDVIHGGPPSVAPGDEAFGGPGADACDEFERTDSCDATRPPPGEGTTVELSRGFDGASLIVRATRAANRIQLLRRRGSMVVIDSAGIDPVSSSGCAITSPSIAICPLPPLPRFALVDAGPAADEVFVGRTFPRAVPVRIGGGRGDDLLGGGRGDDLLEGGPGRDRLIGRRGSDALVSTFDADLLAGGAGSDLLVSSGACMGDRIQGGAGTDSASFARVVAGVVRARIGGRAVNLSRVRNGLPCRRVLLSRTVENLEGSRGRDILIGSRARNNLLGRSGGDSLRGLAGGDRLVGGLGADSLIGGPGGDLLYARDGRRDRRISCGATGEGGRQRASRDREDPPATGC
jgi:Ca2+-binding RTX toxin-like protein